MVYGSRGFCPKPFDAIVSRPEIPSRFTIKRLWQRKLLTSWYQEAERVSKSPETRYTLPRQHP